MTRRCALVLSLGSVALVAHMSVLPAQGPADALARATMLAIDSGVAPPAASDLPGRLRDGLGYLARYVRDSTRRDAERALFLFDQEAAGHDGPWPHYLMARTFLLLERNEEPVIDSDGKRVGDDHQEALWRQLDLALELDPAFLPARTLAVHYLERSGDRDLRPAMQRILAREVALDAPLPDALLVEGRAERIAGHDSLAVVAFRRAATLGSDRSVIDLELARSLATLGDTAAARQRYWAGLDSLTPRGRELYRNDFAWILDADSLRSFDRAAERGRLRDWALRFWAERDAHLGQPPGQRLQEQLSRWTVAVRDYRVPKPWTKTNYTRFWYIAGGTDCTRSATPFVDSLPIHPPTLDGDLRAAEPLLDHRGFTYLRHGEPLARLTPPDNDDNGAVLREVWIYWIEGSWRVVTFSTSGGPFDSGPFGKHAATTMVSYLPLDAGAWEALARLLPQYRKAANRLAMPSSVVPPSCTDEVKDAVGQQRADAQLAWHTDSDSPDIISPWDAEIRSFALGTGAHDDSRALVTFAIPVNDLHADTLADGRVLWQPRFHIIAFRPDDGTRIVLDTLRRTIAAPPEAADAKLTNWLELPLSPGLWELSVRIGSGGGPDGAYALVRNLTVNDGSSLALSDVVTGRQGHPAWPTPLGPFPVNALGTWHTGETVELYYEVSGLTTGDRYHTTLEMIPLDPGNHDKVSVGADDQATGPVTRVRKSLGLGKLKGGAYRLVVTVETGSERVSREQQILVLKPEG